MKQQRLWALVAVLAAALLLTACTANTKLPEGGDHSGTTESTYTTRVSGESSGSTTAGTGAIDGGDLFGEHTTASVPSSATTVSGEQTTKATTTTKAATTTTKLVAQDKDGDGWLDGWYYPGR